MLAGPDQVHYFTELAGQRDRVKQRLVEEDARADEESQLAAARIRADAVAADQRREQAAGRRIELDEQRVRTAAQLDLLAQREDRWHDFRDSVREGFERRRLRERLAGIDDASAKAVGRLTDDDLTPEEAVQISAAARTTRAWEGELPSSAMSRWGQVIVLLGLGVVELPVYYTVFENLHGIGSLANLLAVSLTFATAAVMILAPHIVGRVLRRRGATGAVKRSALPALAVLTAWGYGAWALGELRAKVVFKRPPAPEVPPDLEDTLPSSVRHPQSIVESLHLDPHSVTLMFVSLLLLSGGIAFLLGLAEEHPFLTAYRGIRRRIARLDRAMADDAALAARAREADDALAARLADRRAAQEARLHAVDDLYEAAAHAYLDGVAGAAKDPAMTEAVMRLARQWPLLPERPYVPSPTA